jgi:DnaJ homolog subfamily C member 7
VEHYSAALLRNTESLQFSAICFCNRAAAYQAMGQILDAISDCSLAIALDAGYTKVGVNLHVVSNQMPHVTMFLNSL